MNALEQNDIHILVWGSTKRAGVLGGFKQASNILVPFLDTFIAGNTREEETAYILSAKYIFILELFGDLHPIFSNQYLCCVDSIKFNDSVKF